MNTKPEQIHFGADELRRAAVLAGADQTTQAGKLRVFHDTMAIAAFVQSTHRWPTFCMRGDAEENQLALTLWRFAVRLARHDGYGAPPNPLDVAKGVEDRARRRIAVERPAAPEFWDLSQDDAEGSA